jgi:sugar lactone lactonase YvrE
VEWRLASGKWSKGAIAAHPLHSELYMNDRFRLFIITLRMKLIRGIRSFLVTGAVGAVLGLGTAALAPVVAADSSYIVAVTVDAKGQMIGADSGAHGLFRLVDGKKELFTRAPGKPRTPLYGVRCVIADLQGAFLASDPATCEVYRVTADGTVTGLTQGVLNQPFGLAMGPKGELFVADLGEKAIFQIAQGKTTHYADVDNPTGLAIEKDGALIVVSRGTNNLYRIGPDKKAAVVLAGRKLSFPQSVVVEPSSNYLVSDGYGRAIWRITPKGEAAVWVRSDQFKNPQGLALESDGNLLVADPQAQAVFRVTKDGKVQVAFKP